MIRRTLTRTQKALVLIAIGYAVAGLLAWSVMQAPRWEVRPAQHGPIRPFPTPTSR